jgi:hypothetical protein
VTDLSEFLQPPIPAVEDDYFGGCPICGKYSRVLTVGDDHHFVCDRDLTRWSVGSNLFSGWQHETEEVWRENAIELAGFVEVTPLYKTESPP